MYVQNHTGEDHMTPDDSLNQAKIETRVIHEQIKKLDNFTSKFHRNTMKSLCIRISIQFLY